MLKFKPTKSVINSNKVCFLLSSDYLESNTKATDSDIVDIVAFYSYINHVTD